MKPARSPLTEHAQLSLPGLGDGLVVHHGDGVLAVVGGGGGAHLQPAVGAVQPHAALVCLRHVHRVAGQRDNGLEALLVRVLGPDDGDERLLQVRLCLEGDVLAQLHVQRPVGQYVLGRSASCGGEYRLYVTQTLKRSLQHYIIMIIIIMD